MSLFVLKLPARLDFKLIMSSLEELRQLIQPLFEGNQEAMQAHFQFLQANPSLTLNLNVQNILSLHATAKNSCLLLQREITMIGDSLLQIQDPELPSFLLTNLSQILQNISYKQYHRSISTSISRLARYYIPGGVWSEFFQFFFEIFATITTPDIQISFLDCLSQIVSLPEIDISQVIENIYNIIETFIVLDNPQIIEQTLQLLFSILKNKELYPQFESFVPIITSILTSGIELESQTIHIMRTISNFSQNGADYFTPDSENFINAILALAQSPSDKVRDFSIIVLPNLIGTFAQELKENIPDIFELIKNAAPSLRKNPQNTFQNPTQGNRIQQNISHVNRNAQNAQPSLFPRFQHYHRNTSYSGASNPPPVLIQHSQNDQKGAEFLKSYLESTTKFGHVKLCSNQSNVNIKAELYNGCEYHFIVMATEDKVEPIKLTLNAPKLINALQTYTKEKTIVVAIMWNISAPSISNCIFLSESQLSFEPEKEEKPK